MRVLIDALNLALPTGTGIASYGRGLLAALRQAGHTPELLCAVDGDLPGDPRIREIALLDPSRSPKTSLRKRLRRDLSWWLGGDPVHLHEIQPTGLVEIRGSWAAGLGIDRFWASRQLFLRAHRHFARTGQFLKVEVSDPPEVAHFTSTLPIEVVGSRNVYTVHDLIPLRFPYTTLSDKPFVVRMIDHLKDTDRAIVTVSEATKAELVDHFGVLPERIEALHLALDVASEATVTAAPEAFGVSEGDYFLFFGAFEPKKNLERLLPAFLAATPRRPLLLAGGAGWLNEGLREEIARYEQLRDATGRPLVRAVGFVSRPLLLGLAAGARAVLAPSLTEGFGLAAAEAMACGTAVLTSDIPAAREVTDGGAVLVDPWSITAIADGIRRLDRDDDLVARLAAGGRARAATFSTEAFAAKLDAFYSPR